MARTFGETGGYDVKSQTPERYIGAVTVLIGAAGAVTSTTGMAGITAARTGAGAYSLVYPAAPDVILKYGIQKSTTVFGIRGTARSSTAGTASFGTYIADGTATDPASGDELTIMLFARVRGAT
jgi:hypothetical protein